MSYKILDGKATAAAFRDEIRKDVDDLVRMGKKRPHLAAILVGQDPASETYVNNKVKACESVGFASTLQNFPADISEDELLNEISRLNNDEEVDGFIVQLPLPKEISVEKVINSVDPKKDVDGFHPVNVGRMNANLPCFLPATPYGILLLLQKYDIDTYGKHAVMVGRSHIVGSPMSILLSSDRKPGNCTVTLCHNHTKGLADHTRKADILISATGVVGLIKEDMVKEGAIVVDVGTTRVKDETKKSGFTLKGDVDFERVAPKCSYITPVPGGVGPMTITALLMNTLLAAKGEIYK